MISSGRIFTVAMVASILLHMVIILPISIKSAETKITKAEAQPSVKLLPIEKLEPMRPAALKSDQYYKSQRHVDPYSNEAICEGKDKNYVGIGMIAQPGSNRVIVVPEQYPAYKAGIRRGDVILDLYGPEIVNGYLTFTVNRGNDITRIKIHVEKICYTG